MIYNVAVDGGNSSVKVIVEGLQKMIYPNIVANASLINYNLMQDLKTGVGLDKLDVEVTTHCEKNQKGERFLFGSMAEAYQPKNRSNTDKSKDTQLVNSMLTAIAYSLIVWKQKSGENLSEQMTVRVNLATGLPYHEWKQDETREDYEELLTGNHKVKFNHPFFKVKEMELIIENTLVLVEGESALNIKINEEDNEFQTMEANELLDTVIVGVDLGAFTSEIVAKQFYRVVNEEGLDEEDIVIGVRTMPHLTKGIKKGVGHIMEYAIGDIQQNEKVDSLIRRDIEKAFSSEGKKGGRTGHLVGSGVYIGDYFKPHAEQFAKELAQEFYGLYNDTNVKNKIKKIYISGGGSQIEPLVNVFKTYLKNDGYDPGIIVTLSEPNPIFANAIGYYIRLLREIETLSNSETYEGL